MPFTPVAQEKVSSAVVRQIELLILKGILRPGERLPSERDLAERLGVSRPSLREAIAQLQDQGLLTTRPGAGIFVAEVLGAAFSEPLVNLFATHDEAVQDYIAFRRDMEGLAAERAAHSGTDTDLAVIATLMEKMEAAHLKRSGAEEAALDAQFHLAIIEASHNIVMLHMMRATYDLLRDAVARNRAALFKQRTTRSALLDQHRAINTAIQARDANGARVAVEAHLDYVQETIHALRRAERNEQTAKLRLEHAREI